MQRHGRIIHNGFRYPAIMFFHIQRGTAKHCKPDKIDQRRNQQNKSDKLPYGASFGNPRHKNSDEGRPREPPAPEKQRPLCLPVSIGTQIQPDAGRHELIDISGQCREKSGDLIRRRPGDKHKKQKHAHQHTIQNTQKTNTFGNTADRGKGRSHGDQCNDPDLHRYRIIHIGDLIQSGVDLHGAQSQRRRYTQQCAYSTKRIGQVAQPAFDTIPKNRIQQHTRRQRQIIAIMHQRDQEPENNVYRPGMQSPVKKTEMHRFRNRCRAARIGGRRHLVMIKRFRNAPEHQSHTHAGGKQHRQPSTVRKLRSVVRFTEPQPAVSAEHQPEYKHHQYCRDRDIQPAELMRDTTE